MTDTNDTQAELAAWELLKEAREDLKFKESLCTEIVRQRDEALKAAEKSKAYKRVLKTENSKLRAQLREEQQLHTLTLNERDEARATCRELVTDSNAITLAETIVRLTNDSLFEERALADRLAKQLDDCLLSQEDIGAIMLALAAWREARHE